eukprot:CAMPEP_0172208138 /NCGR_PEP_ID=MMETSP1050-20130122/34287_1 /TAXON_ID=233186 /ORGANISM="Cryptomonas curvata, Strain CCAP979/52" /LENGTH=374 /DNA_ID=CAMNT_0012887659 /DNA_START=17 /DNA_END=1139 /DNA_ORIENTATION=+
MKVIEFRIPFPSTVEEYRLGQIYMVAKVCSELTDAKDGAGVESIANENMADIPEAISKFPTFSSDMCTSSCIYTKKHYHFRSRLPSYVRVICPKSATFMIEQSWNCFPYGKTEICHPSFSKFKIAIETLNVPAQRDSEGNIVFDENVLPYTPEELKKRKVQVVDIADSADVDAGTYSAATDPKLVASLKAGRGPLSENWFQQWGDRPCMIAYKKVVISCAYFGIAGTVEDYLEGYERSLFKGTHRKLYSWMDEWFGMTEEQIRAWEQQMNADMNSRMRLSASVPSSDSSPMGSSDQLQALDDSAHGEDPVPDDPSAAKPDPARPRPGPARPGPHPPDGRIPGRAIARPGRLGWDRPAPVGDAPGPAAPSRTARC